jgi:hypothetical protein
MDAELDLAGAIGARAVEIGILGLARVHGGALEIDRRRMPVARIRDRQLTRAAAPALVAVLAPLERLVARQDLVPTPARHAELRPTVEVLRLATEVGHAVDEAGATQPTAARRVDAPVVQLWLGLGAEAPVQRAREDQARHAGRHARPQALGLRPGLDQQDRHAGVFAQAVRQQAAGGTRPHHDVVVCHVVCRSGFAPAICGGR